MKLGDQQAFPAAAATCVLERTGMTYRQWLVGVAMQGLLANHLESPAPVDITAHVAVKMADAVLSQLDNANDN